MTTNQMIDPTQSTDVIPPPDEPDPNDPFFGESEEIEGWLEQEAATEARLDAEEAAYEEVDHPQHYGGDTTYEVIKVLEAWGLDKDFCLGNTVKYIARNGKKPDVSSLKDLRKALWYLNRKIERLEQEPE